MRIEEAKPLPSYERLHELFEEKRPGVLFWRSRSTMARCLLYRTEPAGWAERGLRYSININGSSFRRSRIIWKMHKKIDPIGVLDHINRNTLDDRIENLRDVVEGLNQRNRGSNNGKFTTVQGKIKRRISLSLDLWPDEDPESIRAEIDALVIPIINRIYFLRKGRIRPRNVNDAVLEHLLSDLE